MGQQQMAPGDGVDAGVRVVEKGGGDPFAGLDLEGGEFAEGVGIEAGELGGGQIEIGLEGLGREEEGVLDGDHLLKEGAIETAEGDGGGFAADEEEEEGDQDEDAEGDHHDGGFDQA
jgi:hypothetical protein